MCIFDEITNSFGRKEENVRQILSEYQAGSCTRNNLCSCAEILTRCMFGPDHKGEFVTQEVSEKVAEDCNRDFCVCTTHPNYQQIMDRRIQDAKDKTIKPSETNPQTGSGPSIGSMGFVTDETSQAESDTFADDIDDKITEDKSSLFIYCKFGPDSQG